MRTKVIPNKRIVYFFLKEFYKINSKLKSSFNAKADETNREYNWLPTLGTKSFLKIHCNFHIEKSSLGVFHKVHLKAYY